MTVDIDRASDAIATPIRATDIQEYKERRGLAPADESRVIRALPEAETPKAELEPYTPEDHQFTEAVHAIFSQPPAEYWQAIEGIRREGEALTAFLQSQEHYVKSAEFQALARMDPATAQQRVLAGQAARQRAQDRLQQLGAAVGYAQAVLSQELEGRWGAVFERIPSWKSDKRMADDLRRLVPWLRRHGITPGMINGPDVLHEAYKLWKGSYRGPKRGLAGGQAKRRDRGSDIDRAHAVLARHGLRI